MNLTALLSFESRYVVGENDEQINALIVTSLRHVINDVLLQIAASIVITVSCHKEHAALYYRGIVQRLYGSMGSLVVQLVYVDNERPRRSRVAGPRLHNLMLVDSIEGFLAADIAYYTNEYNTNEYYYIFLQDYDYRLPDALQRIFDYCWRHMLINCSVQTQSHGGRLRLYTYYPYTGQHCGRVLPVQVNEFNLETELWHGRGFLDFFPLKVRNLHGCPLRVAVRHTPPFVDVLNGTHGPMGGLEGRLLHEMADYINFTAKFQLLQLDERTMNFCCGIVAALLKNETDLGIGYFRLRNTLRNVSTTIYPFGMSSLVSSVYRDAHNLTAWQKLLYPFDRTSWQFVAVVFLASYACAEVIRRHMRMDGVDYHTDSHQLWLVTMAAFLGLPLSVGPRDPHNRLLYASVLWMSFLLRSIYAALLYSLYRDDVQQTLPDTTLALQRGGYEAVLNNFTLIDILKLPHYGGYIDLHWTVLYDDDETIGYQYVQHASTHRRYVVVAAKEFLIHFTRQYHRPGAFHIVREHLHYQHFVTHVRKHSHLTRQFDIAVLRLTEIGLVVKWYNRLLDERYLNSRHLYAPQFIRQHDLNAIYAIASALHLCAFAVFVGELRAARNARLRAIFDYIEQRRMQ